MNNTYTTNKTTFVPGADKISTNDYVKQSKTPLTGGVGDYVGCWHRLPCGLCRITNQPCPYGGKVRYEVTC